MGFFFGGGVADFIFMGARIFPNKSPFASRPTQRSIKEGDVTGAREVRPGTSSDHFHRAMPWSSSRTFERSVTKNWEVLNGVGVDGVGVIFPFFYAFSLFYAFFRFFYAFFPFFFAFLCFS